MPEKSEHYFEKQLIIEQLLEVTEGETIEYRQLSALTGLDLQNDFRYLLDASLDYVLKNHRLVFRNIRNAGYRRLPPTEIIDDERTQARIASAADKGALRLSCVDFQNLPDTHQRRHNAKLCTLALIKLASTDKTVRKIESKIVDAKSTTIEARKALEMLLSED
jgi:hypothetical protein